MSEWDDVEWQGYLPADWEDAGLPDPYGVQRREVVLLTAPPEEMAVIRAAFRGEL